MGSQTNKNYTIPKGEILDSVTFQDVRKETDYYRMFFYDRKIRIVKDDSEQDKSVRFIKFVDMNDCRDIILYVKEGKLKLEKI